MRFVKHIGNEKEWWASHYGVVCKLNLIENLSQISDWSVHFRSYFFRSTGTFAVSTDSSLRGLHVHLPLLGQSIWPIESRGNEYCLLWWVIFHRHIVESYKKVYR